MSDVFDPEDYAGLQERQVSIPRRAIRELEAKAKKADELEARFAAMERSQIFAEAGIPNEGPGAWFRKGYDGEMTVESVKQAYGLSGAPAQAQAIADSLAGHDTARAMAAGASNAQPSGEMADLAALKRKSMTRKNGHMGFDEERAELDAILARAGVTGGGIFESMGNWKLPGQMANT